MTTMRGDSRSRTSRIASTRVSGEQPHPIGRHSETPRPQRDLANRLLSVTYRTPATPAARFPRTWSSSVDFPIPGSPPTRTTAPATRSTAEHPVKLRRFRLDPGVRSEVHARCRYQPPGRHARARVTRVLHPPSRANSTPRSRDTVRATVGCSRHTACTRRRCVAWPCRLEFTTAAGRGIGASEGIEQTRNVRAGPPEPANGRGNPVSLAPATPTSRSCEGPCRHRRATSR